MKLFLHHNLLFYRAIRHLQVNVSQATSELAHGLVHDLRFTVCYKIFKLDSSKTFFLAKKAELIYSSGL